MFLFTLWVILSFFLEAKPLHFFISVSLNLDTLSCSSTVPSGVCSLEGTPARHTWGFHYRSTKNGVWTVTPGVEFMVMRGGHRPTLKILSAHKVNRMAPRLCKLPGSVCCITEQNGFLIICSGALVRVSIAVKRCHDHGNSYKENI